MTEGAPVLELANLRRTFHQGGAAIEVLRGVSFAIAGGEVVARPSMALNTASSACHEVPTSCQSPLL